MLTAYFKRPTTLAAYYAGAAGPYLDSFSDWSVKRGYGSDAIRHLMLGAADFANWAQATGGSLTALPVGVWNAFCEHLAKQSRLHGAKGQHSFDQFPFMHRSAGTNDLQPLITAGFLVTQSESWT